MTVGPPIAPAPTAERIGCTALFALALAVHLYCASLGWTNPPIDGHEFRQAQTALTIRSLAREGLRADYPTPLLGKPWAIPLEFPAHQGVAALVDRHTGLNDTQAGRLTSLLFFYASLPALYLLGARLGLGRWRALLVPACILVSPLYLYYSRAVLIESTAFSLGLWFVWFHWVAVEGRRGSAICAAIAAGALSAMVKLPTFCAFLLPALLVSIRALRTNPRWAWPATTLAVGAGFTAGLAWSRYADALKRLNPLAETLQSGSQRIWATGDLGLRFDPALWTSFGESTRSVLSGWPGLVVAVLALALAPRGWRLRCFLLGACFLAPLLVFANVYRIHDYYYYANAAFLLGAVALALGAALAGSRARAVAAWTAAAALLPAGWSAYYHGYHGLIPGNAHRRIVLPEVIRAATRPDDVVVILGQDWNPVVPYLADRRALMLPFPREDDFAARQAAWDNLSGEKVGALVVTGPRRQRPDLVREIVERFDLSRAPALSSAEHDVHLPRREMSTLLPGLMGVDFPGFQVATSDTRLAVDRLPAGGADYFPNMSPAPRAAAAQFGLGRFELGTTVAASAHPDCELVFTLPAGAKRLRAGFGILPAAFQDPAGHTDGVRFSVLLERSDGTLQTLTERLLAPFANPADREIAQFDVALPADASGDLILRTDPGPAGDRSFDWAFWTFVRIE